MEVEIVTKPEFTVLGLLARGKVGPEFIPPLWDRLFVRINEIQNKIKSRIGYGVMSNYDETTKEFNYLAGFDVESGIEVPEGMIIWKVPDQTYAVIRCTIPTIMQAYQFFAQEWSLKEGYQRASGPEFEFYPENFNPEEEETSMIYLYIPIKK